MLPARARPQLRHRPVPALGDRAPLRRERAHRREPVPSRPPREALREGDAAARHHPARAHPLRGPHPHRPQRRVPAPQGLRPDAHDRQLPAGNLRGRGHRPGTSARSRSTSPAPARSRRRWRTTSSTRRSSPSLVRQDHIIMSRMLGANEEVVGAGIGGMKIGGDVDDAFLLFPDPMGATGSSLATAIETYKTKVPGKPRRIVNIHLIVTPEYLRTMTRTHPDVVVYAIRAGPRPVRAGRPLHRPGHALGRGARPRRPPVHRPRRRRLRGDPEQRLCLAARRQGRGPHLGGGPRGAGEGARRRRSPATTRAARSSSSAC